MRGRVKRREREISFSKATVLRREKESKKKKNRMRGVGGGGRKESRFFLRFSGLHRRALLSLSRLTNTDDWINTVLCSDWMNLQTVITVLHRPQQSSTAQALPPDTELLSCVP